MSALDETAPNATEATPPSRDAEEPKDWRENLEEAEAPPDFAEVAAPVLALKDGATMNEVYAAVEAMCEALKDSPRSTCHAARDVACKHLKHVVKVQAPTMLFDSLLRENRPEEERPNQVDELVSLGRDLCDLFHDGDGRAFADVRQEAHRETHPLRARSFARILRAAFFAEHERGVCETAVRDAVATLEGFAFRDGPVREVFVRFGRDAATGKVYLDLGDPLWRAVQIDENGWRVVAEVPVRFVRPAGLRPLPEPSARPPGAKPALDLAAWKRFVHVDEKDRPVVRAWLVAAILVQGPYVTLVLLGEQGSGKSTTARVIRILVDPVKAPLRSPPREERDIVIAAGNGGLVAFDNISYLSDSLADAMCRLSTGAGFGTRALYTDDEEFLFEGKRPQLLNGISNFISRDDLGDRSAVLKIPVLDSREPEVEFWAAFEAAKPGLLADLLDLTSATLACLPGAKALLEGEEIPRMADFARIGVAADLAAGGTGLGFLDRYRELHRGQEGEVLTSDSVGALVLGFLKPGEEWTGTATELLDALGKDDAARRRLPKTPRGLTAALDRLKPALRRVGIYFERAERGEDRGVRLSRAAPRSGGKEQSGPSGQSETASQAASAPDRSRNGQSGDGRGTVGNSQPSPGHPPPSAVPPVETPASGTPGHRRFVL